MKHANGPLLPVALFLAMLPVGASTAFGQSDEKYLEGMVAWRGAVISYVDHGPGLFNVAPSREMAYRDRALMCSIKRDGIESSKAEIEFIHQLLASGNSKLVSAYANYMRKKRVAEMKFAVVELTKALEDKTLNERERKFLEESLDAAKKWIEQRSPSAK